CPKVHEQRYLDGRQVPFADRDMQAARTCEVAMEVATKAGVSAPLRHLPLSECGAVFASLHSDLLVERNGNAVSVGQPSVVNDCGESKDHGDAGASLGTLVGPARRTFPGLSWIKSLRFILVGNGQHVACHKPQPDWILAFAAVAVFDGIGEELLDDD